MDVEKFLKQCERILQGCEKQGFDETQAAMCCAYAISALLPDRKNAHALIDATYKVAEGDND
jgi:hypothetical protein